MAQWTQEKERWMIVREKDGVMVFWSARLWDFVPDINEGFKFDSEAIAADVSRRAPMLRHDPLPRVVEFNSYDGTVKELS